MAKLPTLELELTPRSAALLWLVKELAVEMPLLVGRLEPEFCLPSKWDVELTIDALAVSIASKDTARPADEHTYWIELGLQRVGFSRVPGVDKWSVGCIVATSPMCEPIDVLTLGKRTWEVEEAGRGWDESIALTQTITKGAAPLVEIDVVAPVTIYMSSELLSQALRFHDLNVLPTSDSRRAYWALKAAANFGMGPRASYVNGRAWGGALEGGRLLLASCAKPAFFSSMKVSISDLWLELAELAKLRFSELHYSKTQGQRLQPNCLGPPPAGCSPATVRKVMSLGTLHGWSLAGERPRPGAKLPCVLALIGSTDAATEGKATGQGAIGPGLQLELDDTKPFWACPWLSQQVERLGPEASLREQREGPRLSYIIRAGTLYGSLQGDFLQRFVDYVDLVAPVANAAKRERPPRAESRAEPLQGWALTPLNSLETERGGSELYTAGGYGRKTVMLSLDVEVSLVHVAVPVGQGIGQQPKEKNKEKKNKEKTKDKIVGLVGVVAQAAPGPREPPNNKRDKDEEKSRDEGGGGIGEREPQGGDGLPYEAGDINTRERHALVLTISNARGKGTVGSVWSFAIDARLMSGTLHARKRLGYYVPHHELTMSTEQPLISEPLSVRATVSLQPSRVPRCSDWPVPMPVPCCAVVISRV